MNLRELFVKLGVKADDKKLKEFDKSLEGVKSSMIAASGVATAFAGSLFALVKTTATAGDAILDTAQKYGISTQALQELTFAARDEADALNASYKFLNKSMSEAADGSEEQAESFRKLGVNVKDANGNLKASDDVLLELSNKFKDMPNGAKKTALAMKVFGRSGADLIPFLNQGADEIARLRQEAVEAGYVMDGDALQAADNFQKGFYDLTNTITGLKNTLGTELMPVITDLMKGFKLFLINNRAIIKTNLTKTIAIMTGYLEDFYNLIKSLYTSLTGIVQVFGGWERAIKAVLTIMLAVFALRTIYMIGAMAQAIFTVISAMRAMGMAALIAQAKILLIPLLIGAAIVAIGLIIEDLIAFFQGRDSVTAIMIEEFTKAFDWLQVKFDEMNKWAQAFAKILLIPFRAVVGAIRTIGAAANAVMGDGSFSDVIKTMADSVGNTLVPEKGLSGALGFNPSSSPVSNSNASTKTNNVNAPITVNVPPGTSPMMVGEATQAGVTEALQSLFRQTEGQIASPIME